MNRPPPPRPRPVRHSWVAALTLLLTVVLLGVALPAQAHDELRSTVPADLSSVASVPAEIVLTFDEPAVALGTQVVVSGPDGPVQLGEPKLVDSTVAQPLRSGAPAGAYTVNWRVTSADGHPVSGTFTFTAEAAGGGSESSPTATAPPSAAPAPAGPSTAGKVVLVGLFVLLAVGVTAVVQNRLRRRRSRT